MRPQHDSPPFMSLRGQMSEGLIGPVSAVLMTLILGFGCADEALIGDEGMNDGPVETNSDCPAEFYQTTDEGVGVCLISDIEGYYEAMERSGGQLTDEDLLNVDNSDLEGDQMTRLAQEGVGKFFVYVNETKRIGVRVINYVGMPVPGMQVNFEISMEGTSDPIGSTISSTIATSDEFGVASIEVTGGSTPTWFKLVMTTPEGDSLPYGISVNQQNSAVNPDVETLPPGQRCNIWDIQGAYDVENSYQLGRLLGDGFFNTLQTINRGLTDPGGLIGDWIRDRIGGFVGDAVRGIVREVINNILGGLNMPMWAQLVTNIITDVTAILTDLQIKANIRLGGAEGVNCDVIGVHTWEELIFVWQGNNCPGGFGGNGNNCGEHRINLSEVGVSASESEFAANIENQNALSSDLVIHEHDLDLNVGVVLLTLLQTVILPQRANVRSIGELIASIMPCDQFGQFAASLVGFIPFFSGSIANFAAGACRDGVEALGNNFTRNLLDNITVSAFKVQGRCKMRSNDDDNKTELMYEGVWEEGSNGTYLQGTFEGTLRE